MSKKELIWNVQEYKEVESTNDIILDSSRQGAKEGLVVYAYSQKKGRGRLGRTWYSPKRDGLYFSFLLRPKLSKEKLHLLSLSSGLGVAEGLQKFSNIKNKPLSIGLKWPNDIRVNKKKIGGILCEIEIDKEKNPAVTIGIGVNTNMNVRNLPDDLRKNTTSLKNEGLGEIENKKLLYTLLEKQKQLYNELICTGFEKIQARWTSFCDSIGERVYIKESKDEGRIVKINSNGHLVIQKEAGELLEIFSNEII
ncbi:MAG: biotin--[acetyl-CoA-carboxylase] ligase [Nitrospinota bacterium]|nr:biotin--[acetyl-CoA-carboxylase] ligase [Nitrospinota bacterium]